MAAYVSAIEYVGGSPVPLMDVLREGQEQILGELLQEDGFADVLVSDASIVEMSVSAIEKTLASAAIDRRGVGALIFCTESMWDCGWMNNDSPETFGELARLRAGVYTRILRDTGLSSAHPFGLWMTECANFTSSMMLAESLVNSGRYSSVLIVTADRVAATRTRLVHGGTAALSDLACCTHIADDGLLEIDHIEHVTTTDLWSQRASPERPNARQQMQRYGSALAEALRPLQQRNNGTIIGDNVHSYVYSNFMRGAGLSVDDIVFPTKSRFGHTYSSDCFLALRASIYNRALPQGSYISAVNIGPVTIGVSRFRVAQRQVVG